MLSTLNLQIHLVSMTVAVSVAGILAGPARGGGSLNVELLSRVTNSQMGTDRSTDCWGYVSASGREYAIMANTDNTAFIEITDPRNPVIVGTISHTSAGTADAKVFGDYVYVANGSGGGIDVIDVSDIDNGNVTLVQRSTEGGVDWVHNIAIDEDSGFLYLAVGSINSGALVAYDLSDPANPTVAGFYSGSRSHDLTVVTYTAGPYAGRQIAFSFSESRGVDIIDVTDKSNMFLMSRSSYDGLAYCHNGGISADSQYLFVSDELDAQQRTTVFNIADLENPVLLGHFSGSEFSTDHNLFVKDGFIFEANYLSGLRIFEIDTANPVNSVEVGYYDTTGADGKGFSGAWAPFPYYPSGNVIVSDRDNGLFVFDVSAAVGGGIETTVDTVDIVTGTVLGGGVAEVIDSDDTYYHTRSGFGQTFVDAHNMEMIVGATTNAVNPATIDLQIESRIDEPAGTVMVSLRNWTSGNFELVGQYAIGSADTVEQIIGIAAAGYVNDPGGAGDVDVSIKHIVFVPFLAFTFQSFIDQVVVTVNE